MTAKDYIIIIVAIIVLNQLNSYQNTKSTEAVKTALETKLDSVILQQNKALEQIKQNNINGLIRISNLDKKIKKDANYIDNRIVTDDEIAEFLAKHRGLQ